jgi:hypothetical protein
MQYTLGTPGASSDLPFHPTLHHPLTGMPLQAVGIGRRGPIWPILGGAPDEGGTEGGGDGADTSGGNDSGQQQDTQNGGSTSGTDSGQGTDGTQNDTSKTGDDAKPAAKEVKDLPAWAQKEIRDARKQAADARGEKTKAEQASKDTLDKIAVALGLKKGEEVDPEKLQQQLTADVEKANSERDEARLQLAVFKAADTHSADPSALLDSREFLKEVRELDATDKSFADDLAALIKQRVKDNPTRYGREAPKPKKSGSEHMNGGQPGERTGSLHAAVAKTMNRT